MFNNFDDPISNFSASSINWNNIINQGFGVGSQVIAAWGRNPTTQIGYNAANGGIFAIGGGGNGLQPYQQGGYTAQQLAAMTPSQNSGGGAAEDAFAGITNYVSKHPILLAGIGLGAYLLFREPPRRR